MHLKSNTKIDKKIDTNKKTSNMESKFNIKVYDYNCSAWFVAARLAFMPDDHLAEMIADSYARETFSGYSKLRICNGATVLKELSFE